MSKKVHNLLMIAVPLGKSDNVNDSIKEYQPKNIEHPKLKIGTLDSLISLSDELIRVDSMVENFVRKIEKQYSDLEDRNIIGDVLKVDNQPSYDYVMSFKWDRAKYITDQPLTALVSTIQGHIAKYEEELRNMSSLYSEKSQLNQAANRMKKSSVMTADPSDILKDEHVRNIDFYDTEYLITLVVAVSKSMKKTWEETYTTIGSDIASMGCPNWSNSTNGIGATGGGNYGPEFSERAKVKGSPVVPGSSKLIMEDSEGAFYTVTILKGQYQSGFYDGDEFQNGMYIDYIEPFKKAAKEKRFNVREFKFDPERSDISSRERNDLKEETKKLHKDLTEWCKGYFGEAMVAWIHIKVVRSFVDGILQYGFTRESSLQDSGLNPNFMIFLVDPKKKEREIIKVLDKICEQTENFGPVSKEDQTEKDDYHPYVLNQITLFG